MKFVLLCLIFIFQSAFAKEPSIDLLLKARGLQAVERIEALAKKNGNSKGRNLTKKENCEWTYESLYYAFAHPEIAKIVKRSAFEELAKGTTAFVFLFLEPSNDKIEFQLNYIYRPQDTKPLLSEIATLKDGWRIKVSQLAPHLLSVTSKTCIFTFNLNDPLDVKYDAL